MNFSPQQAEEKLRHHLKHSPAQSDITITYVRDLDIADLFAFSVMPAATGLAGENVYLVGPDEILKAGTDFDIVMKRLGVGQSASTLDINTLANLFLRFRVLRRGVILEQLDGHALLRPGQLTEDKFHAPRAGLDAEGAHFQFWTFDTDWLEPVYWDVRVEPGGTTSFTSDP